MTSTRRPRVLVVANGRKAEALAAARRLAPWLARRAEILAVASDWEADLSGYPADFVLVFGGDGTLLSAARRLGPRAVPLLGVNLGHLGFLAGISATSRLREGVARFLAGKARLSERMRLEVAVKSGRRGLSRYLALNDAVIAKGSLARIHSFAARVGGETVLDFKGDGLILATPTGSTAYGLSAGGPVLAVNLAAILLVPICPHDLASRPVVVPGEETVEVRTAAGEPEAQLTIDGQVSRPLAAGELVVVRQSRYPVLLAEPEDGGRYERVRRKLHYRV